MELLITLLIYILFFAVLYYVLNYVLGLLQVPVFWQNITKALLAIVLLIFIWGLIANAGWLPRLPPLDRNRP
jgi:hypothetical protein